jgi:hypothetical protein
MGIVLGSESACLVCKKKLGTQEQHYQLGFETLERLSRHSHDRMCAYEWWTKANNCQIQSEYVTSIPK